MNLPGIPSVNDVEAAGEKLEDRMLANLNQFSKETFAELRALLDEYQVSITFTRKDTTK